MQTLQSINLIFIFKIFIYITPYVIGYIISIIYKGDHYKYKIRSKNDVDYYVDDEWLWNMGDYVSVVVPDDKITYEVINKGARDD